MHIVLRISVLVCAVALPGMAWASGVVESLSRGAIAIPEPGNVALLLLGVTGLIIGRRASRVRQDRKRRELDAQR